MIATLIPLHTARQAPAAVARVVGIDGEQAMGFAMTDINPDGGPDVIFQKYLADGRFMIQRGVHSGCHVFYPRSVAPGTGEALEWVAATGFGTVYSMSVVRKRPPEASFNIALIDLDEGPRMMSRVEGIDPADVRIGMRVRAAIRPCPDEEGVHIVLFHPAGLEQ